MDSRFQLRGAQLGTKTIADKEGTTTGRFVSELTNFYANNLGGTAFAWAVPFTNGISAKTSFVPATIFDTVLKANTVLDTLSKSVLTQTLASDVFQGFLMPDVDTNWLKNYAVLTKVDGIGYMSGTVLGGEVAYGGRNITGIRKDTREIKLYGTVVGSYDRFVDHVKSADAISLTFYDTFVDGLVAATAYGAVSGIEYDQFSKTNNFVLTFVAENEDFIIDTRFRNTALSVYDTTKGRMVYKHDITTGVETGNYDLNSQFRVLKIQNPYLKPGKPNTYVGGSYFLTVNMDSQRSPFSYCDSMQYYVKIDKVSRFSVVQNSTLKLYDYGSIGVTYDSFYAVTIQTSDVFSLATTVSEKYANIYYSTRDMVLKTTPTDVGLRFLESGRKTYIPRINSFRNGFYIKVDDVEVPNSPGASLQITFEVLDYIKKGF